MKFSIIIPTYNSKGFIKDCLSSVFKTGFQEEVIVVDNASQDGTVLFIKDNFPKVRIVELNKNFGYGAAANKGAKKAKGEYLIFLNPDTILFKDSLEKLDSFIKKTKNFGVIGFNLVNKKRTHEKFSFGKKGGLFQILKNKLWKKDKLPLKPFLIDWVSGAAMAVRKSVFEKVGGFDEKFFMYFEDQDLCFRIKLLGYPIYFLPDAKIIHLGGKAWKSSKVQKKYYYQSQDYFFKKHFGAFQYFLMKVFRAPLKWHHTREIENPLEIFSFIVATLLIVFLTVKGFYIPLLGILFLGIIFLFLLKDFKWAWVFLVLSLVFGQLIAFEFNGARVLITDMVVGVIFLFWLLKKFTKREKIRIDFCPHTENFRTSFLGGLIIFFGLIAFLSLLNSARFFDVSELKIGFFYLLRLFLYLTLYFVFFNEVKKKELSWVFNWFLVTVFLIAVLGLLQLVFFPDFSFMAKEGWDPHQGRLFSTWFDPNLLSLILVLGIVVIIGLFFLEKIPELSLEIKKWLLFFFFIVFLIALVLTYSRSGYLTFLATIFFLGILKSRKLLVTTIVLIIAIALTFPFAVERVKAMKKLDETAKMRLESWRNASRVIKEKPVLGVGYNNLPLIQGIEGRQLHSKSGFDSSFLTIWATTGIFGFLTLIAIFVSGFLLGFKLLKKGGKAPKSALPQIALGIITLGALTAFLVHSQFVNSLLYPHLAVVFWSFLGIVSGVYKNN